MPTLPLNLDSPADTAAWEASLLGEKLTCMLLSRVLYRSPDRPWLERLIRDDVFADPPVQSQNHTRAGLKVLQGWAQTHQSGLSDADFDRLKVDYMSLFVGPGKLLAPPWQSVYANRDRVIFQMQTIRTSEFYRRFGLELASSYHEPADHIGLQFEFLTFLAERSLNALHDHDAGRLCELIKAQREFLADHMVRWVPRWRRDVMAHARTDLYVGIAELACGILADLAGRFDVVPPQARSVP